MRTENRNSEGECYQVNSKVRAVYDDTLHAVKSLKINGDEVSNANFYSICTQGFHFNNASAYLNISQEELLESGKSKLITTSAQEVLEEYLRNHQNIKRKVEGRLWYST